MRHNGRPVIFASSMAPNLISLRSGERPQVVCTDCGRWTLVRRSIMYSHRDGDGIRRCPGSGQRVRIDLAPADWLVRLREAEREAGQRRGTRGVRRPKPPVPRAVHQIAASRIAAAA